MLHEFISANRDEIIGRCRAKVGMRPPARTVADADHGVPAFLEQLVDELRAEVPTSNSEITRTATKHGHDLLIQGYSVSQVVHEYGNVCQAITEMAVERQAAIGSDDFRRLNRCLDDAIAGAVTEYGRKRDATIDVHASDEDARFVAVTQDLQVAIHTAGVAFGAVKTGRVGVAGSTGSVLEMSLSAAHVLVDRLLAEYGARRRPSDPLRPM